MSMLRSPTRALCTLACRVNSGPGRYSANKRCSGSANKRCSGPAAERLSKQGRTAGSNTEASPATTRRPCQRAISDEAGLVSAPHHQIIERDQRRHVQVAARSGKGSIRHPAHESRGVAHRSEETIEHGLLRLIAHRQQRGNQRRQRQFAIAGESIGKVGWVCGLREFCRCNPCRKLRKQ